MIKYNEVLYKNEWIFGKELKPFRFRSEPVPFIHKEKLSYFKNWYKTPKSTNEKRQFYGDEEFVRGKRKPINLPNAFSDYPRPKYKSWKENYKCKRQWEIKRG
jgi:hypothetical protein